MDAQVRTKSFVLTVAFHAALLLLLYFLYLHTQIPPFGGGGGSASNIGLVEISSGNVQPLSENPTPEPEVAKAIPPPVAKEEKILTTEDEEAPKIEEKKENKIKKIPPVVKPVVVKKEEKKPEIPPKPKVNENALYKGKSNKSTSQGTGTVANGDQGTRNGDPNSLYKGNGGNGTGGGTGDGNGTGNGPGNGPGSGPGISFNLAGRKWFAAPKIDDTSQEQGKVVVAVKVDKGGNVVYAEPGARGSTTTSSTLYRKAKEAAMRAKFNASPDGIEEQKGTITFVFILQ